MPTKIYAVLDAVALFYLQKKNPPKVLQNLQQEIINRRIIVIIPTVAISEILWKLRKEGEKALRILKEDYLIWKKSSNIIIDSFDAEILEKMLELKKSYELHDEIIAMTCNKYKTKIIYTKDPKFKDFWGLNPISW